MGTMLASWEAPDRGRGGGDSVRTRDHLANVRSLLAWIRLSVALMALGFALARLPKLEAADHLHSNPAYASIGMGMAALGWMVVSAAWIRFVARRRSIEGPELTFGVTADVGMVVAAALAGVAVLASIALGR